VTNSTIHTAVALGPAASQEVIEAACADEPTIELTGFISAHSQEVDHLADAPHQAVIVACADEADETLAFISGAVAHHPECPVVVVYEGAANGFVRKAFDAGAADLVSAEISHGSIANGHLGRDIAFALEKAIARGPATHQPAAPKPVLTRTGEMIAVLGPKGGTGKTLTSCNLAGSLARAGKSVVIVDLDLQFGDVGLALGLKPEQTIYDLATSGGTLDSEKVEDFLMPHESGIRALLAPRRPDHAGAVTVDFVRELFDTLMQMAEYVVVDTPPGFTPEVIAAIDKSTQICVVAMLDSLSLKNTKLALETLELMEYDPGSIKVVLNRADSRVGVTHDDVASLLGRTPDVRVPSHRDITRSVNEARPIAISGGNTEARKAFHGLAASYIQGKPVEPAAERREKPKRRGLFGRRRKDR
jgi:pilus assembly protein CpaE